MLAITQHANAVSMDYAIEAGISRRDNIRREPDNQIKDTVARLAGELNVVDESSTNDFVLGMSLEYLEYLDNTFDDEVIANINLESNWSIIDDSFTWAVNGFYGQQPIDAYVVRTPDNLQDTGFYSTGPNLIIHFTNLDSLTLNYRYNDFYAELTDADYQSNYFGVSLSRRISPLLTISLNSNYTDLRYEFPGNNDLEDTRYTVSITGSSLTTQYSFEVGGISIKFEDGSEIKNSLKLFSINRQLNRGNIVSMLLSETVDNGAAALDSDTVTTSVTADLFVNKQAQFSYIHNIGQLRVGLGYIYSDQDYISSQNLDQKVRNGTLDVTYGTPLDLRSRFFYQHAETEFYNANQLNKEDVYTLSFAKRLTGTINIEASYENYNRSERGSQSRDIEENVYMLTFRHLNRI